MHVRQNLGHNTTGFGLHSYVGYILQQNIIANIARVRLPTHLCLQHPFDIRPPRLPVSAMPYTLRRGLWVPRRYPAPTGSPCLILQGQRTIVRVIMIPLFFPPFGIDFMWHGLATDAQVLEVRLLPVIPQDYILLKHRTANYGLRTEHLPVLVWLA